MATFGIFPPQQVLADSLDELAGKIDDTEIGGLEFVDSAIRLVRDTVSNVVIFKELDPPDIPALIQFAELDQLPAGVKTAWRGLVVIGGNTVKVAMFRIERPPLP